MKRSGWSIVIALCLAVPLKSQAQSSGEAEHAVRSSWDHYIAMIRLVNSDSVAAAYTADAILLEPDMAPLSGREAIRAFLAPFDGTAAVDSIESAVEVAEVYGETAYLWGSYFQRARLQGHPPSDFSGRLVAQMHLEQDGHWRIRRLLMQPAPR
jgi:ketosteroid isomerase-like protein